MAEPSYAEIVARRFHEVYEEKAPDHGYKTREASAVPWEDVPVANKALMIEVAGVVVAEFLTDQFVESKRQRDDAVESAVRAESEVARLQAALDDIGCIDVTVGSPNGAGATGWHGTLVYAVKRAFRTTHPEDYTKRFNAPTTDQAAEDGGSVGEDGIGCEFAAHPSPPSACDDALAAERRKVAELREALRAVEQLHDPERDDLAKTVARCPECWVDYPCPTVRIIAAARAALTKEDHRA